MTDTQLSLSLPPHNNHQLFSDHYLKDVLPTHPEWTALARQASEPLHRIADLFAAFIPNENERQLEEDLVIPILAILGHTAELQATLKTPDGARRPDYVFYRDEAALRANKGKTLTDELPQQGGFAVGDAKHWNRSLDCALQTRSSDFFSNRNPSYQIFFYMQHSGVEWGILTNGRLWRLYHRDTAHKLDCFYEVDLQELVQSGNVERFLYFYAFFRREAFDDGPLSLARILRESAEQAQAISDRLKDQVYDALRHLAQGFLDYAPNGLQPTPDTLKEIYDNSLILLYRLIFILYAEARELLPVRESEPYRETYSLHAIKQSVARDLRAGRRLLPGSALLWPRLQELFRAIDQGNPPLHVATFNGGLFDAERHAFLARYTVGDAHLQQAIDMLARVEGEFVDYRDLSVRHMGTIYEGLLEYRLTSIAPEGGWTLDLVNDKGERKATGSYYTPDYIVKYIVEQTVGPMLRAAVESAPNEEAAREAILRVNVLDPAMGSGHFLVEATEHIARFLVDRGIPKEGENGEADLAYWKRRVAQSCIYGVDLNPLAVELAKLSLWLITVAKDRPLSFLDHHLRPGNSLVGASLAKLQPGATGRKSHGARKAARAEAAGQASLWTDEEFRRNMSLAVGSMWLIEGNAAATVEDVKKQEYLYAELRAQLIGKYGRLADLMTATHFGLHVESALWTPLIEYAAGRPLAAFPQFDTLLAQAKEIADRERFFHWELEFPEVFFDAQGKPLDTPGFDAVIGNPPYVRQEQLAPYKPYFAREYPAMYHGVADLFIYFFAQGLRQTQRGGRLSYISSNSWLRANYAGPLRQYLQEHATVETVVDFGNTKVFTEAPDVYPAIHFVVNETAPAEHIAQAAVFARGEDVPHFEVALPQKLFSVSLHDQPSSGWRLDSGPGRRLLTKLLAGGKPLGEVVNGRMYRGVLTGLNDAFIIDTATRDRLVQADPASARVIKPMLRGEDLRPWYQEDEGRWLIALPCGWTRDVLGAPADEAEAWKRLREYLPALAEHLRPFADAARNRCDKGEFWWELRPCAYYEAFDAPKILWPDLAKFPRFSWDETGYYLGNTGYIMITDQRWLVGYLASRCVWFVLTQTSLTRGERAGTTFYRLIDQFMRPLPIPDAPSAEREAIGALALAITERARARYALHQKTRHRIQSDLGTLGKPLGQKLTAWWDLDFPALRAELKKRFRREIPIRERDEWEDWFDAQRAKHARLTEEIVQQEQDLNARVYDLFRLTPEEILLIEESTKYRYGEV